ncbi:hypothetical protein MNBD_NITROSPINAE04-2364 [hydrothermal vent metagenome]|uniref:Uncharacterized protein n=1 Tax=hydrothermal vent metagenome TaxID=652676 RepID=A0A3B1BF05_9ZZZZ
MDFSDLVSVNQKLAFSLTADIEAQQHRCLVRKIKGSLMAVVVSNRDKDKITLSVDDDIYFFHDLNDETCVTRARIAQNQSYPLVIVDMASEPVPISGPREPSLPSMLEGIESVENDHLIMPEPVDEPVAGLSDTESIGVEPVDETPENELLSELLYPVAQEETGGETAETDAGKSGELLVERVDIEDVIVLDDELMNIPDIDTSELEAELEADIADSLEEKVEEPGLEEKEQVYDSLEKIDEVYADDSLEDMEIERSELLDIGEIGGQELDSEADDLEEQAENRIQAPEAPKEPVGVEAEPFEDFFDFEFVVVDSETAEKLEGIINKYSSAQRFSFDAAEEIEDLDFTENDGEDDAGVKGAFFLKNLLTRADRSENRAVRLGSAADNQLSFVSEISEGRSDPIRSAICLKIDKTGIHAALDGPLPDGACVLLMVNRRWNPPLHFDAVAVLLDSESGADGISSGRFRFIAIHSDDAGSVDDYLRRGSEYLALLKQMTHS